MVIEEIFQQLCLNVFDSNNYFEKK